MNTLSRDSAKSICLAVLLLTAVAGTTGANAHPEAERWSNEVEAAYDNVKSYTAVFHKQQRVAGKLLPEETIQLKFKKPSSLYMSWIKGPYAGSELIYVEGWNQDRVRAHRGGLLRFIARDLDPRDPHLMKDNLRPVTHTGIGYLAKAVATKIREAISANDLMFSGHGEETVYGRRTQVFEVVLPRTKVTQYDGRRLVINQDVENKILIRIRIYDQADQLVENYTYERLNLDARLTAADFDPENPEYRF